MKFGLNIFCVLFLSANLSLAQIDSDTSYDSNDAPVESVYIHTNASILFSGEYLYYSLYCFDTTTKRMSELSKMAYVELISSTGERIFWHKIKLEKGRGYSDFFVPVTLQTGSYKLVAYTNWMQNTGLKSFGNVEIQVINPYSSEQKSNSNVNQLGLEFDNLQVEVNDGKPLLLEINNTSFNTRDKVMLTLLSSNKINDLSINGSYSLSVKRKLEIPNPKVKTARSYIQSLDSESVKISELQNNSKLPELRGELIKGIITALENTSTENLEISVSLPNDTKQLRIARVNNNGEFYFTLNDFYYTDDIFFQVIGEKDQDYKIELQPKLRPDFNQLEFTNFSLKPEWKDEIINQSIYNQIENAYFEFRADSLYIKDKEELFEGKEYQSYILDEYNRFPTLRETIKEYVSKTSIRRDSKLGEVFQIQGLGFDSNTQIRPLVLLDGILVDDHNKLMDYNANYIQEIKIYRDQLVIDSHEFQGAIVINTFDGFEKNDYLKNGFFNQQKIETPQFQKTYFLQKYNETNRNSRLPDYRQQLIWLPILNISNEENHQIEFFTSDVLGVYEICLEGFTEDGRAISVIKEFQVN